MLLPLALPIYLATRPLKNGEVREGGTAWNVLKNFAYVWTFVTAFAVITAFMAVEKLNYSLTTDVERATNWAGEIRGLSVTLALWFVLSGGAVMLGFSLKKDSVIETGPEL